MSKIVHLSFLRMIVKNKIFYLGNTQKGIFKDIHM